MGVTEYQLTANVWLRGILEDYYGVPQTEIHWIRGGLFDPKRPEKIKVQLPEGLDYREAPEGATLNELMAAGEIDGLIGPRPPRDFYTNPNYGRLFPDTFGAVAEYYQNTQIFPIARPRHQERDRNSIPMVTRISIQGFRGEKSCTRGYSRYVRE